MAEYPAAGERMTVTDDPLGGQQDIDRDESGSALAPYLVVLAVGVVIGLVVLGYVALHRAEIVAILTQSPS